MRDTRLIRLLIAAFAFILASKAVAQGTDNNAPPMISLEQYLANNSLESVAARQFVFMRCSALYAFLAGTLEAAGNTASADQFLKAGASLLIAAQDLETNKSSRGPADQIGRMVALYSERAKEAKARTGSFSDDPIIRSDAAFCKGVAG